MTPVTDDEFEELLLTGFAREAIHLEMRDAYGTAVELPHMAKWASGEPDDLEWLQGWCTTLREHVKAGRSVRRARVVSEPLSDYQRWSHSIASATSGSWWCWKNRHCGHGSVPPRYRRTN